MPTSYGESHLIPAGRPFTSIAIAPGLALPAAEEEEIPFGRGSCTFAYIPSDMELSSPLQKSSKVRRMNEEIEETEETD